MTMLRLLVLTGTHGAVLLAGIALGIYLLPIITEPEGPPAAMLADAAQGAQFTVTLREDLAGNDFLHWGKGSISVSPAQIVHQGSLAPGPDYKLYLTTAFVEDEAGFLPLKDAALQIGDVKTFGGFIAEVPAGVDITAYNTVVIWCESFGEFITAGQYR